jgi:predicted ArsR family transcriptional regulator
MVMETEHWPYRLLKSRRGQILTLLRTENRTVNDLAAVLHLTDNAVRAHLSSLERDDLVQKRGIRPGTTKPHTAYGLTSEAEHIFPNAYGPLLNHFLAVISKRLPARALPAAMREVGRAVAEEHLGRLKGRSRVARIETALNLFNNLGGSAMLENDGKQLIHGCNGCPLAAVTPTHPEACLVIESLLSEIIGAPVKKCCEYAGTPRCCFELDR